MSPPAARPTTKSFRRAVAAVALATGLAAATSGCVGRAGGNDTPKQADEQNPARKGPPYEKDPG